MSHPERLAWAVVVLASFVSPVWGAQVVPITGTSPDGRSYSQLAEDWWQWALSMPLSKTPLIDHFGDRAYEGQSGPVFWLAPTIDTDSTREIVVQPDKYLFFPLVSAAFLNGPGETYTEAEMRQFVGDFVSGTSTFYATIDGVQVPQPWVYRASTPAGGFSVDLPADDIYLLDQSGIVGPVVADGFWLLVEPLDVGTHTIRFEGGTSDPTNYVYFSSVTYTIRVPEPGSAALALVGATLLSRRRRK